MEEHRLKGDHRGEKEERLFREADFSGGQIERITTPRPNDTTRKRMTKMRVKMLSSERSPSSHAAIPVHGFGFRRHGRWVSI